MEIRFGERPLDQTVAAAGLLRRLTGLLLAQEHPQRVVAEMLDRLGNWERELTATAARNFAPRVGAELDDGDRRVYLDHAFDIGSYNPCFPEYGFETTDPAVAAGRVVFPIAYEGPPGLVHGGFLGVFFDCVVQQHNCAVGRTGKTRSLTVTYRRPTPILAELSFTIERTDTGSGIESVAVLRHDTELLCEARIETVAASPDRLRGARYGRRRVRDRA
ncbi:hypothetical protein [Skermania piniformis]|uniref:Thioesterase domain-containing protein n=1 Tax=Skermania pinensis TaxID=39122 RepID=A0ABX8S528_9ACTN|nr:hypothetical protein [Skermania piniformis]QXQ12955.1 hypothetical protein KV203_13675 [Skermania piniformis]